jgi:hypothetical protein
MERRRVVQSLVSLAVAEAAASPRVVFATCGPGRPHSHRRSGEGRKGPHGPLYGVRRFAYLSVTRARRLQLRPRRGSVGA